MTTIIERFALRRGTASAWTSANPILADGEEGYEKDTRQRKVGDGVTHWNDLPYSSGTETVAGVSPVSGDVPVAGLVTALKTGGLAPLASPTFTGDPKAPTPAAGDNDTSIATTAFVHGAYQPLNLEGVFAARPAANTVPAKSVYFATDDNGGKEYRSDGASWLPTGAGVSEMPGSSPLAEAQITTTFTTTSVYPTFVDVTGLTGITFIFPASGKVSLEVNGAVNNNTASKAVLYQIVDATPTVQMDGGGTIINANASVAPSPTARTLTGTPGASMTLKMQVCVTGGSGVVGGATTKQTFRVRVMAA